jgi:protein-disulfide isomerase
MRVLIVVAAVAAALSCSRTPAAAKSPDDAVVAEIGDHKITYGDLRKKVGAKLDQMKAKYLMERRTLESDTLRGLVEEVLLTREAKARGLTVEALLEAEVAKKIPPPSEEDIRKTYEEAKAQIDLPLDVLKPRITQFLREKAKRELRSKYLDTLRAKAGVKDTLPDLDLPKIDIPEAGSPARGPAEAPVKVVIFSDFECPYCSRVVPTLHELYKRYEGKIRMVFRDFPLSFHENARRAAEAAHCANEQGKFWEYHDRLFAHQDKLTEKDLVEHAKALQLDAPALEKCLQSGKHRESVERNLKDGERLGVSGTPAVFVNGMMISGAQPLQAFTDVVDLFLKKVATR